MNEYQPCRRPSGTVRAYFSTREEADAFAHDPANHPTYAGDIAASCARCGYYHLNRPKWLEPQFTHQDGALLESMGIAGPEKLAGGMTCARCHVAFRVNVDFLILPSGEMVCETC